MRLRFRTALLTVALLTGLTPSADACLLRPLLAPFHCLFGCPHLHGCGPYGAPGCYGPGYGYGYGHGRPGCLSNWLGFGYLHGQQGTLGHYPGRPFGCYQPMSPQLMNPCLPCAPVCPPPMVAPAPPPMMMPMPAPMYDPCMDPCQMPGMMQYSMSPQFLPYGHQGRQNRITARDRRLMRRSQRHMPQMPSFGGAPMYAPMYGSPMMYGAPMMDGCCDEGCGSGVAGPMIEGTVMPQDGAVMSDGGSCCGDDMQTWDPLAMQGAMMPMEDWSAYAIEPSMVPYSTMSSWYGGPGMSGGLPTMPRVTHRQQRLARRQLRDLRPLFRGYTKAGMVPYPMPAQTYWQPQAMPQPAWHAGYAWPGAGAPHMTAAPMPYAPAMAWSPAGYGGYGYAPPMTAYAQPAGYYAPQAAWSQPYSAPLVAGDVMGDHELVPATASAAPIVPNSYSGGTVVGPAVWTTSGSGQPAQRYDHVVQ